MKEKTSWELIEQLFNELVQYHQTQLLKCGCQIIPHLTSEDLLQPNDYPELEFNPYFRYEEGVLTGIQTAQMALQALKKQQFAKDSTNISFSDNNLLM